MPGKVCPRCHDRLAVKARTYCKSCDNEYQAEVRRGEHKRGRLCEACGEHFNSRGETQLCRTCRSSPGLEKTCTKCNVKFFSHRGTHLRCGACRRELAEYAKTWYRDRHRQVRVDKTFGLKPGQFDQMLEEQDGKCPICGLVFQQLAEVEDMRKGGITVPYVDHDHSCCDFNPSMSRPLCGKCVRQLVCRRCNVLLGHAGDSVEILTAAAVYIQRWRKSRLTPVNLLR